MESSTAIFLGVICLLTIISILLMIILLKVYCKRRNENTPDSNLEGGIFRMNDLRCTCTEDSSSTSSESSIHSLSIFKPQALSVEFGDAYNADHRQYLNLKTTLKGADYENALEGKSSSTPDYENVKAEKNQDYVNMKEQPNTSSTKERKSKADRPKEKQEESVTSSESSSDESDDTSVNYSNIVFNDATNAIERRK